MLWSGVYRSGRVRRGSFATAAWNSSTRFFSSGVVAMKSSNLWGRPTARCNRSYSFADAAFTAASRSYSSRADDDVRRGGELAGAVAQADAHGVAGVVVDGGGWAAGA